MNFLTAIFIAVGVLAGIAVSSLYVSFIHDPKVAAAAREGYVQLAEKTAAEAKATEMERQRNVASQALTDAQKRKEADDVADQARQAQSDAEVADYEKKLQAANRGCTADSDDVEFLLKH